MKRKHNEKRNTKYKKNQMELLKLKIVMSECKNLLNRLNKIFDTMFGKFIGNETFFLVKTFFISKQTFQTF